MSDQQMSDQKPTKAELLQRIQRAWEMLENTLRPLSDDEISRPSASGWTIKDHLAHMAVWETGMVALLEGGSRFGAMRVDEALVQSDDFDTINEQIYQQYVGISPLAARRMLQTAHQQMLDALERLSDEDLLRPYADFLPEGSPGPQKPVLGWIYGNTAGHFEEHNAWIQEMLAEFNPTS